MTQSQRDNFQDRGDAARRAAGIDGTAGDAQDINHAFVLDKPTGGCLLRGLAESYRKHIASAPAPGLMPCPTCGPTPEEITPVCTGTDGFCDVHGFHRHAPAPDGLREQYMAAIIRGGGCVDLAAATDAVLAVRDEELLRLRAETATYRLQIDDLIRRNSEYAERAIANGERADKADRALEQQLADARAETAIAAQLRVDVQRERDRLAATVERVRRLAERWENALTPDRPYARALRTALDEPRDGAGADTARRCGSTLTHPSHKFMRLHVVFNCPGTTPEDPS